MLPMVLWIRLAFADLSSSGDAGADLDCGLKVYHELVLTGRI